MKQTMAKAASSVLTKVANYFVTTMCISYWHAPEVPQELARKTE